MEKVKKTFFTAKNITYIAVFAALIIALQMCSSFIKIGATSFSFVLVPIVLGGMLMGVSVGAALGALFGVIVLVAALAGLDPFTLYLLGENPAFTVFLCLIKGIAAGVVPALLYKLVSKKNGYVAVFVAAASAPIMNTGLFIAGAFIISGTVGDAMTSLGVDISGLSPFYIILVLCVGVNFFVEFAINLICSPAIYTVNRVIEKQISRNRKSVPATGKKGDEGAANAPEIRDNNDNLS